MTHWQMQQLIEELRREIAHLYSLVRTLTNNQAKIREDVARLSGELPKKEKISKAEYIICGVILLYILWLLDPSFVKTLRGFVTPMRP